jgi:hypothetical protein
MVAVVESDRVEQGELEPSAVSGVRSCGPSPFAPVALGEGPDLGAYLSVALSHDESGMELVWCGVEVVGIASGGTAVGEDVAAVEGSVGAEQEDA